MPLNLADNEIVFVDANIFYYPQLSADCKTLASLCGNRVELGLFI